MSKEIPRREVLKGGLALAGLASLGIPKWAMPAVAQGEVVVPFTDFPADFNPAPRPGVRYLDTRTIDGFLTPADKWFTVQHYNQPEIDKATYRLRITGMVSTPREYTLDELKKKSAAQHTVGFECSGNSRRRVHGLVGNGRWTGISLSMLLKECGISRNAKEVVFFGADKGTEEITLGGTTQKVEQNFARSLSSDDALRQDVFLAYELNGEPLSLYQGAPLRLIVPGWYGVAQVKWLQIIHVQDRRFMGRYMARSYVTLRGRKVGDQIEWTESSVSRMQLKSVITRLTKIGNMIKILGFALTDTTPLKAIEVKIDDGPWKTAMIDKQSTSGSWKLFTYMWEGATPGEHSLVSRAIDVNGVIQPAEEDELKKTPWENNEQMVRKVMVS
ncbi:MAG TPA: molybdopterin-dependent oxidoreductase [Gemmatimonadales bacterium]|jgi:DMSO/TMAO reductase YedYZ molybdopterin-dependent catalytic subunit|nr:molybdopterin-dependent oxidoreductase [Gemmatimonadales bacterium]